MHIKLKHRLVLLIIFLSSSLLNFAQNEYGEDPAVFLSNLIQIRSITGDEGSISRFLLEYCTEKGLKTRLFSGSDSSFNLCASLYPLSEKKPNIVFLRDLTNGDGFSVLQK